MTGTASKLLSHLSHHGAGHPCLTEGAPRHAVFHPVADRHHELIDALRAAIPAVHQEDGCRLYAIHDADDGTITMIEKWDSRDPLAAHNTGPAIKALQVAVADLISQPTTMTTMTTLPAGTAEHGVL
jgi:quinol monooxygenase YgiN